ncbi:HAMP domain-containing sensor histidine kinase [Sediminicoccus sp. KRV36]|uniref:sensor histidine kinase n=1 Tax=Sediminicoccus sp. KRV36 TaxID=3133721 RepID=UPI00200ED1CD|nr:HAMP domain-containing sensor histidine kinase [Sediminicoccus rosea]UPY37295.1 HAMP domain-containing histidine kinase [Sediminicoccus rosea]
MRAFLFGSTGRQVAWVVALATISSNLMVLAVWLILSPGSVMPGSVRAMAAEIVAVVELLEAAPAAERGSMAATAGRQLFQITPISGAEPPARLDAVATRAVTERLAERGLPMSAAAFAPSGSARQGLVLTLTAPDGEGWQVMLNEARMRLVIPSLVLPPTTAILLLGVPLLLVLLWVASRVTRPLAHLARAAESIAAAWHHAVLPEMGTSEVRRLARAINGLLARLHEDVAERARILAGVSHDLRTPLTRLRLRVETVEDAGQRQRLGADLGLMERIVGASLSLLEADLREEEPEVLDVAAMASTVCDQFADAGHDVTYDGPLHLVVRAQPNALERALSNLVDNACKHAGSARILLLEDQDMMRLTVEDDGPGIAEVELPHITEAFRRNPSAAEGFGLGLAIVASVARAHGGQLRLRNRVAQGLSAELRLPITMGV